MATQVRLSFENKSRVRDELKAREDTQYATLDDLAQQCTAKLGITVTKSIVRGICKAEGIPYKGKQQSAKPSPDDVNQAIITIAQILGVVCESVGVQVYKEALSKLAAKGTLFEK